MTTTRQAAPTLTDLLFEKSDAGLCLVAPDGTVLRANAEWLRSTGYTADQVLGEDVIGLFPQARDMALAMHARARAGDRVEVPRHAVRVNGREVWWEGSVEPVPLEGGTGLLITARDVTPRDRARHGRALEPLATAGHAPDDKYRSLFQYSRDAVYLTLADGTILEANPAACELHRMTVEEIRAAGRAGLVVNDERHAAALKARAAAGRVHAELTVRRKDGSTVPVETHSVLLDPANPRSPAFVISRDLSERKRAEQARARHEELLSRLFERLPLMIAMFDPALGTFRFNDELRRVLGWTEADAASGDFMSMVYPDAAERDAAVEHMTTLAPGWRELRVTTRDGAAFPSAWANIRLADDTLVGIGIDLRERKQAEAALREANERLREADRRKDEFLAMLSHELRNPLAPIRNSSYVLRHAARDSEQARRAQAVIERQTEHIARLVDDLLDVTRIARGKIALRRARIDLRDVVRRAADDYRTLLEERGVVLAAALPDATVWADADATRIAQVVGNLLHNAAKFTRRGDAVEVAVRADGGEGEIRVRDTGRGIDAALLPRIFEAFTQGARALDRSEGGLGLGLALVKGIVEQHGGTVRAESAGVDRGAEFVVRLPLVSAGPAEDRDRPGGSPG